MLVEMRRDMMRCEPIAVSKRRTKRYIREQ